MEYLRIDNDWDLIDFNQLIGILSKHSSKQILIVLAHSAEHDSEKLWKLFCEFVKEDSIIINAYKDILTLKP